MNWTDQRLDDLANRVDAGFKKVGSDMRGLRTELKGDVAKVESRLASIIDKLDSNITEVPIELKGDIGKLDAKFDVRLDRLDAKFDRQQILLIQLFVGFFFALIGADAIGLIGS